MKIQMIYVSCSKMVKLGDLPRPVLRIKFRRASNGRGLELSEHWSGWHRVEVNDTREAPNLEAKTVHASKQVRRRSWTQPLCLLWSLEKLKMSRFSIISLTMCVNVTYATGLILHGLQSDGVLLSIPS